MDDETAKATAKDTIAALSTLTPEQQDQLVKQLIKLQTIKKYQFYNKQKHKRKTKQTRCESRSNSSN
ncbi:hypothetical protein FNV33_02875 [Dolosigranulum pigrum]|uniref:Uncharacterized protein n=1 Tax=Dolosigranulum pigrum TaxID=29394 RepID=A0A516GHQ3_9LACT|nr:hypothetical protein FNV33_02875 [Dolosigranulum pigrum]